MIIVWGVVDIAEGNVEAALELSLVHVRRSREEPGCISHNVQIDAENRNRLTFFEKWQDMEALQLHFAVPESGRFVKSIGQLASAAPVMTLYESSQIKQA